jgi:nucleoside-diphosphate-sugar epimerase
LVRLHEVIADSGGDAEVAIVEGNLLRREDCARAAVDVTVIFHLAAGVDKSYAGCFMNSVLATRNLLDAAVSARTLKRFVNVSSFAVYSNFRMKRGALLDESAPLETEPNQRHDPYGFGKLKQEQLVERYQRTHGISYVMLRPGSVYGPGKPVLTGRIGIDTFGVFLHMGGSNRIPLTYVDNCAEAIVLAGLVPGVEGQVFNIVDDDVPTSRRFLRMFKQRARQFWSIPVPYPIAFLLSALWRTIPNGRRGNFLRTSIDGAARRNGREIATRMKN